MVVVEVVAVSSEGRVIDPLHAAVFEEHMVQPRWMMQGMQPMVSRGVSHDRVMAAAAVANRLERTGGIAVPQGVAEVAPICRTSISSRSVPTAFSSSSRLGMRKVPLCESVLPGTSNVLSSALSLCSATSVGAYRPARERGPVGGGVGYSRWASP